MVVSGGASLLGKKIENYREILKKLRDDIRSEVVVTAEVNVFRILSEMESITAFMKELSLRRVINIIMLFLTDLDLKLQNLLYISNS